MEKFRVMSWRDYHGVETFFLVVNQYGERGGVFASEWEAVARAKELNEPPPPEQEELNEPEQQDDAA